MSHPLFVYGTLMSGEAQAGLLGDASRAQAHTRGTLWDLPAGYPALSHGDDRVEGELVVLPIPGMLAVLDRYEGVDDGLYERVLIDVMVELRRHRAWAYVMTDPRLSGGRRVPGGGRWSPTRRR